MLPISSSYICSISVVHVASLAYEDVQPESLRSAPHAEIASNKTECSCTFVIICAFFCCFLVVPQNPRARETGKYYGKGAYGKHGMSRQKKHSAAVAVVSSPAPPAEANYAAPKPTGSFSAEASATAALQSAEEKGATAKPSTSLKVCVLPTASAYICSVCLLVVACVAYSEGVQP